jgi:DNA-binding NtrC family response regulator
MVTVSPQMHRLFELVRRAARSESTVLVRGASGTGKELVASALHAWSPRNTAAFRAANCATFTPELLASELFGHVRGAFTGAVRDKSGLFAQAHHGTLFLDEIAELPLPLQARLLRVLQTRRFMPVGATEEVEVDVRLVSATHAALRQRVAEGRFREDLMYRVRVVVLYLPDLVDREGDLEALTWHFVDQLQGTSGRRIEAIEGRAWEAMRAYRWPGNVRELRNNLEQAFVLGEGPVLTLDELAPELSAGSDHRPPGATDAYEPLPRGDRQEAPQPPVTVASLDQAAIEAAWHAERGHRGAMARRLGVSRSTLYRRMKRLGMLE